MIESPIRIPLESEGNMTTLSQLEVEALLSTDGTGLYEVFRRCSLAVLNSGNETDNVRCILERYRGFRVELEPRNGGIELKIYDPPPSAFVDGSMIRGMREHLYAVLRDILFAHSEIHLNQRFDLNEPDQITAAVFQMLRNANVLRPHSKSDLVVCWGGHSIGREEYEYTKRVGYHLGLRGLDICTGCGPGAMKGPMKGAAVGHAKQRLRHGRYVGISEPGIITAESPNPIVNELVIMPDIEKRLEAFVRLGHVFVIFPGGVGTAEELLYILGNLLHPANQALKLPLVLTGPAGSERYFEALHEFIGGTLGPAAQARYQIVVDDPTRVAEICNAAAAEVRRYRAEHNDATYFLWNLTIDPRYQLPFEPTHESMATLNLRSDIPGHELAANLRCAFSGIVAGNVKEGGVRAVEEHGPFNITGDPSVIEPLHNILRAFVKDQRMMLRNGDYKPPYVFNPAPAATTQRAAR